ncbi:hypothetical protein [Lentzea sp. NPDC051838]|uniref:hypothetical protein n=1 Tax=Lentzea sp. NPDC051838 TaxID=3154849 RepID=UPI003436C8F8
MRLPETNDQSASVRATTKKIGLRIAALTGVVLSASAIAAAPAVSTAANADVVLDSVVSVNGGGSGSTCCRPEN